MEEIDTMLAMYHGIQIGVSSPKQINISIHVLYGMKKICWTLIYSACSIRTYNINTKPIITEYPFILHDLGSWYFGIFSSFFFYFFFFLVELRSVDVCNQR